MKNRLLLKCIMGLIMLLPSLVAFPQSKTITGVVKNETGSPLQGASVVAKGQSRGVTTDANGAFRITVPTGVRALHISYVDFETQEIPLKNEASLDVTLHPSKVNLDEVVVVGYG